MTFGHKAHRCAPRPTPSPLGKAWLKRFLAYTHIVHLNCFPLFLLEKKAQKKKLTKRNAGKEFRSCGSDQGSAFGIRKLLKKFDQNFRQNYKIGSALGVGAQCAMAVVPTVVRLKRMMCSEKSHCKQTIIKVFSFVRKFLEVRNLLSRRFCEKTLPL